MMAWLRTLLAVTMSVVVIGSLVAWYLTRETLPEVVRLATADEGGLYYRVGRALESRLEERTGREVEVLATLGSVQNRDLLMAGEADLAILQGGAIDLRGLVALAPIHQDIVHVVTRRADGLGTLGELAGRRVALGPEGSGMRESAKTVLAHYGIDPSSVASADRFFMDLREPEALDAAIVTTGLLNPDLGILLATGDFALLPILDAEALSIRYRHFTPRTIPRGFYRERPPVPPDTLPTIATTSFLAARSEVSDLLVRTTLEALYEGGVARSFPTAITRQEASDWRELPMHPASQSYFQPYSGLGILANLMESLAALKELLFAFGAGLYLVWAQWQRRRRVEEAKALQADKDRLDVFLGRTMEIERAQVDIEDAARLKECLDRVTAIKLQALEELTHEELRGDVTFTIFLQQCGDLARKIQGKMAICGDRRHDVGSGIDKEDRFSPQ